MLSLSRFWIWGCVALSLFQALRQARQERTTQSRAPHPRVRRVALVTAASNRDFRSSGQASGEIPPRRPRTARHRNASAGTVDYMYLHTCTYTGRNVALNIPHGEIPCLRLLRRPWIHVRLKTPLGCDYWYKYLTFTKSDRGLDQQPPRSVSPTTCTARFQANPHDLLLLLTASYGVYQTSGDFHTSWEGDTAFPVDGKVNSRFVTRHHSRGQSSTSSQRTHYWPRSQLHKGNLRHQ